MLLVPTSYPREGQWSDRAKASHLVWTGLSLGTPNLIRVNMVKCKRLFTRNATRTKYITCMSDTQLKVRKAIHWPEGVKNKTRYELLAIPPALAPGGTEYGASGSQRSLITLNMKVQ